MTQDHLENPEPRAAAAVPPADDATGVAAAGAAPEATPEELAEIEAERSRRLDPQNRPDNSEVDNSDAELPTVQAFDDAEPATDDSAGGTTDPSETFRKNPPSEEEAAEIEAERARRLAPENRPDNCEVDNT